MAKEVKKPTKKVSTKAVKDTEVKKPVSKQEAKAVKPKEEAKKVEAKKPVKKSAKKAGSNDTGSIDFQIKNFTSKITVLTKHLKEHSHDFDSRRGLLIMVGKRRRLLNYLRKNEPEKYLKVITELKLKK
jgi:small subunit ribosomal protein S15